MRYSHSKRSTELRRKKAGRIRRETQSPRVKTKKTANHAGFAKENEEIIPYLAER
jgi:hypothetical protein